MRAPSGAHRARNGVDDTHAGELAVDDSHVVPHAPRHAIGVRVHIALQLAVTDGHSDADVHRHVDGLAHGHAVAVAAALAHVYTCSPSHSETRS